MKAASGQEKGEGVESMEVCGNPDFAKENVDAIKIGDATHTN